MTLQFTVSVTMDSDWHIGSGQGRHRSIDRLIDRDWDDLPFIPAATLRGIWRDSAQLLARGLDDGQTGAWAAFAERLFGSEPMLDEKSEDARKKREKPPAQSLITLADALFPEPVRAFFIGAEAGKKALRQALTFIKPGVSIDLRSGAAKTDFLRFEEVARAGAALEAEGAVDCADADAPAVAAFLAGAAALIERLGGKRRRGMGKCTVSLKFAALKLPDDAGKAADYQEKHPKPPELVQPAKAPETRVFGADVPAGDWKKFALRLTLQSPLIAADEVQGNVITCQDHIPSGLLLAPIASRLADAGVRNVWTLIAGGDVRVLPGTPEIEGHRSLPVPFCWEEEKGLKGDVRDYRQIPRLGEAQAEGAPQHVLIRSGFVSQEAPLQHQRSIAKVLRTHNTIKDEIQRPHEDVGGVYTYEALAAGQTFWSEVWIRGADVDAATLSGEVRLGRARQAGYGRVEIKAFKREEAPPPRQAKPGFLTVWLTSDAILPNPMGSGGLEMLASAIASVLGRKQDELFSTGEAWASLRWRRVEGWQSRWALPRPTLIALQAGSVAEFKLETDAIDAVAGIESQLEREGIGARKGEGFGCILVDHENLAMKPTAVQVKIELTKAATVTPSGKATEFIETIYHRAWERCIALRAEMAVSEAKNRESQLGWTIDSEGGLSPNMSQLGAMRAAMGELSEKDLVSLKAWLKRLKTADKWQERALNALAQLLTVTGLIWQILGVSGEGAEERFAGAPRPATSGFDPVAHDDLRRYAIRTLLLEAMRFHKRDGEERERKKRFAKEKAA